MKGVGVGKFLSMGPSAVSRGVYRGEQILLENKPLKKHLDTALHIDEQENKSAKQ
jgi:hypothetical protein